MTTNRPGLVHDFGVRTATDAEPGEGALEGLRTALRAARGEWVPVAACDMPLLCRPLLQHRIELAPLAEVIVPRRKGEYEPMHAVYARTCLPTVEARLAARQRRVIGLYDTVRTQIVTDEVIRRFDPLGLSIFNINTPDDLDETERWIRQPPAPGR